MQLMILIAPFLLEYKNLLNNSLLNPEEGEEDLKKKSPIKIIFQLTFSIFQKNRVPKRNENKIQKAAPETENLRKRNHL